MNSYPTSPTPPTASSSLRSTLARHAARRGPTSRSNSNTAPETETVRLPIPGRWSDTLKWTLGYSTTAAGTDESRGRGRGKGKGKAKGRRAALPASFWSGGAPAAEEGEEEEMHTKEEEDLTTSEQEQGLSDAEWEIHQLAERILWPAPPSPSASTTSSTTQIPPLLLIVAGCHFPPPPPPPPPSSSSSSNSELLSNPIPHPAAILEALRKRLQALTSECDSYSLVLLASPTPSHPPSTPSLVASYLALDRGTRKRLTKVWVVGGGWWLRILLTLFTSTLLSSKGGRKVSLVTALSELAEGMGAEEFRRIDFPLEVYAANASLEPFITLPASSSISTHEQLKQFAVPLEELMPSEEAELPRVVRDCLEVLSTSLSLFSVGIFRRSPSATAVKHLREAYDRGQVLHLPSYVDAPHLAASLLKLFLRSLPSPIIPTPLLPLIRASPPPAPSNDALVGAYIREVLLPPLGWRERRLLGEVTRVLQYIASGSGGNLMTSENLAVVMTPNLLGNQVVGEVLGEMCRLGVGRRMGDGEEHGQEQGGEGRGMTLAGVVVVMIERRAEIFDPDWEESIQATPCAQAPDSALAEPTAEENSAESASAAPMTTDEEEKAHDDSPSS